MKMLLPVRPLPPRAVSSRATTTTTEYEPDQSQVTTLPADASDGERTFVFICREYVKEFEPTTLKGLSKLDMQAKITEKKEAAKQVAAQTHALCHSHHLEPEGIRHLVPVDDECRAWEPQGREPDDCPH